MFVSVVGCCVPPPLLPQAQHGGGTDAQHYYCNERAVGHLLGRMYSPQEVVEVWGRGVGGYRGGGGGSADRCRAFVVGVKLSWLQLICVLLLV